VASRLSKLVVVDGVVGVVGVVVGDLVGDLVVFEKTAT
jgi:hypothetical protein